ncbi:hypothetical protein QRX50_22170 [Amycolatopsis carbonis]|uniref:Uncharacterized protein n=1 Tax=Amycolatopsis carbonis TaxID=715471 RepID=A0A9Y2INB3_9PSEU|nr:hypothetical protein [Amycolatopsis sp. 2-15]WIX83272.1 hypothetical protein QRX50_22170 [Amycolatopsis sp. 2-15]
MAATGVRLLRWKQLPADVMRNVRTVITAAEEAKQKLADGTPIATVINALTAPAVATARDAAVTYRGPC